MTEELDNEESGTYLKIKEPKLDPLERLYVRSYLVSLSHLEAHRFVEPHLKHHSHKNKFALRENVSYHIQKGFLEKEESLRITQDLILEKLYKEATREGNGSNHSARIAALTTLGKHLGMFQDKKDESKGSVINIINYSEGSTEVKVKDQIDNALEQLDEVTLSPNLQITEYSSSTPIQEIINEFDDS